MLMMMDCGNRKPPVDLSGVVVVAAAAAAAVSSPESAVSGTWHPHVYGDPPRTPTGHNIADILGWTKNNGTDEQPLNLCTARRRTNGTVLDLTKIKRKGTTRALAAGDQQQFSLFVLSYFFIFYFFFCSRFV